MIDKHRRHYVYDTVFQFIIDNNLKVFPISVQKLCSLLNTELVTLSDIVRHSNLRIKDVFDIWGNEDGCVMAYEHNGTLYHKIAYNDNKPLERIRFTVCEECMHILLGHTKNPSFNAFQQSYSPPTYAQSAPLNFIMHIQMRYHLRIYVGFVEFQNHVQTFG